MTAAKRLLAHSEAEQVTTIPMEASKVMIVVGAERFRDEQTSDEGEYDDMQETEFEIVFSSWK